MSRSGPGPREALDSLASAVEDAASGVAELVRPKLRGWLHAVAFPLALVGGIVLIVLAPGTTARISVSIYTGTAALLFGVSAIYHRGHWSERVRIRLKRLDHANIFLIIAGTYTPFALLALPPDAGRPVLWIVWSGAVGGVLFRVLWLSAPRWLYVPLYIALGWVAVLVLPGLLRHNGVVVVLLLLIGGILYSAGGIIYALRRPDPFPRVFGFHEVFHALTLVAFLVQYVAISLVVRAA